MMEFVNGKDNIPYMKWKIKFMFESTNQVFFVLIPDPLVMTNITMEHHQPDIFDIFAG